MYMSAPSVSLHNQTTASRHLFARLASWYEVFCGRAPFLRQGFGDLIIASTYSRALLPEPLQLQASLYLERRRATSAPLLATYPRHRPQSMERAGRPPRGSGHSPCFTLATPVIIVAVASSSVRRAPQLLVPPARRAPLPWRDDARFRRRAAAGRGRPMRPPSSGHAASSPSHATNQPRPHGDACRRGRPPRAADEPIPAEGGPSESMHDDALARPAQPQAGENRAASDRRVGTASL